MRLQLEHALAGRDRAAAPSAPVPMDAGSSGVARYEFHLQALPGERGVLVNVVSYGSRGAPRLSGDGRLLAFVSDESGAYQAWVAEMLPGGEPGRPIRVKTAGRQWHAWAADGRTLFVQDDRDRLLKVVVSLEPQLSVSEPVEVADLGALRVQLWEALSDGRFFVGLKFAGEGELQRFDMALNWTGILERLVPSAQ